MAGWPAAGPHPPWSCARRKENPSARVCGTARPRVPIPRQRPGGLGRAVRKGGLALVATSSPTPQGRGSGPESSRRVEGFALVFVLCWQERVNGRQLTAVVGLGEALGQLGHFVGGGEQGRAVRD